uniref:Uncharacterized protein n=1 Tax=Odontella aurita TaxID=265563 RepID=A0A7S4JC42_9STRA|mmetsp:Transcript_43524/g.132452  ORF Transcript_43524/g.132452 Transcript_43524/m.132452 type:complete len:302 (+) Transcript_43524:110-1015(+)
MCVAVPSSSEMTTPRSHQEDCHQKAKGSPPSRPPLEEKSPTRRHRVQFSETTKVTFLSRDDDFDPADVWYNNGETLIMKAAAQRSWCKIDRKRRRTQKFAVVESVLSEQERRRSLEPTTAPSPLPAADAIALLSSNLSRGARRRAEADGQRDALDALGESSSCSGESSPPPSTTRTMGVARRVVRRLSLPAATPNCANAAEAARRLSIPAASAPSGVNSSSEERGAGMDLSAMLPRVRDGLLCPFPDERRMPHKRRSSVPKRRSSMPDLRQHPGVAAAAASPGGGGLRRAFMRGMADALSM